MTNYYIYETTNNVNGKKYRGMHQTELPIKDDAKYIGSGNLIKAAIDKYGRENFSKVILEVCPNFEALKEAEAKWVDHKWLEHGREHNYNLMTGGRGGCKASEETKRKISRAHKGFQLSDETKRKISRAHKGNNYAKGNVLSNETKSKMSMAAKGRKHTEETKAKISKVNKGQSLSEEQQLKQKLNYNWKGKHHTEETKAKISELHKGTHRSNETKEKMKTAWIKRKQTKMSEETKAKLRTARLLYLQKLQSA